MKKSILINASNLSVGGGVQVAVSFFLELPALLSRIDSDEIHVFISEKIRDELIDCDFDFSSLPNLKVVNTSGLVGGWRNRHLFCRYDLIFTIFGPVYFYGRASFNIVGFAQSWIIYPDNEAFYFLPFINRYSNKFKFFLQWCFFSRSDRLVVEMPHVKNGLVNKKGVSPDKVDVVMNTISPVFFNPSVWKGVNIPDTADDVISLVYVSRGYIHKNIGFIFQVAKILRDVSYLKFRFILTLSDEELLPYKSVFEDSVISVGPISLTKCPSLYAQVQGAIFPSLLESFSATPLEAIAMGLPLFASDRQFVRDCCADYPSYFDPMDPQSAAAVILQWYFDDTPEKRISKSAEGLALIDRLPNSRDRALSYIDIINKTVNG